jgi:hypothetical protein
MCFLSLTLHTLAAGHLLGFTNHLLFCAFMSLVRVRLVMHTLRCSHLGTHLFGILADCFGTQVLEFNIGAKTWSRVHLKNLVEGLGEVLLLVSLGRLNFKVAWLIELNCWVIFGFEVFLNLVFHGLLS